MDAFLIPRGFDTRQETHNGRLHDFFRMLPEKTLLTGVCPGFWIYGAMGLLDGSPPPTERSPLGWKPQNSARCRSTGWRRSRPQPASPTPAWSMPGSSSARAALLQAWRWASTSSAAQAMTSRCEVARVMQYKAAYDIYKDDYKDDVEYADA